MPHMNATTDRVTMIDILKLQAKLARQSGQKLDALIADQIDNLARTAEKWDCTTSDQLRDALRIEAIHREFATYPSRN